MPKAGWCDIENSWVWLNEDGSDAAGHDASHISNAYDAEPGTAPPAQGQSDFNQQAGKVADDVGEGLKDAGQQLGDFAKKAWSWGKDQAKSGDQGNS